MIGLKRALIFLAQSKESGGGKRQLVAKVIGYDYRSILSMGEVDYHLLTGNVHKMLKWEALNDICRLGGYAEARNTQYKNEENAFSKKAHGEFFEFLKGGYRKLKSDIESILTEMNSMNKIQQEYTLKKILSSINEFLR